MKEYTKALETEEGNKITFPFLSRQMDGDGIRYNIQVIVISNEREKVPRIVCEYCVKC